MQVAKLEETLETVKRFVRLSEGILRVDSENEHERAKIKRENPQQEYVFYPGSPFSGARLSGELRRASLDLTNRFAELRRS